MPSLRVTLPGKGPKVYPLFKKITSIGRAAGNDVQLSRYDGMIHGFFGMGDVSARPIGLR